MSKENNLTDFLTDVADAIREKKGSTDLINPQDFSDEIKSIPSGGNSKLPQILDKTVTELIESDLQGVTSIGTYVFYQCRNLTSIIIPNGVASIGAYAFSYCVNLTTISIPDSVTSIESTAFSDTSTTHNIYFRGDVNVWVELDHLDELMVVSESALYINANPVTSIKLTTAKKIASYAFYRCRNLTSVDIPDSVTSIGNHAFYDCRSLSTISIPDSVTSIGTYAFYQCSNITSIDIPYGVKSIGNYTFASCGSLATISIPDSVRNIGGNAFRSCTSLTAINIPNAMTSIGTYAFYQCRNLTSVDIPDSVTSIGTYAFSYCSGLTNVSISDKVTTIGSNVFSYCTKLTSITCKAVNPPTIQNTTFSQVPSTCIIKVPAESVEAYKKASNWSTRADYIQAI